MRCTLFCATAGDAGRVHGARAASGATLAEVRRRELHDAARVLGVASVEQREHGDGALAASDPDPLVGEIVEHLRRERSTVVITFGPEGGPNAHADHRAVSRAATAAFFLAGSDTAYIEQLKALRPHAPARLFYVSWPVPAAGARLSARAVPATARVDVREFIGRERAAFAAHASQDHLRDRFEELCLTDDELFALAAGAPQPHREIHDLFAGL